MPDLTTKLEVFDSRKLVEWTAWIVGGAAGIFVIVSLIYFSKFHGILSSKQEIWGQFGDFIGGTLNPVFSFLALIVLVLNLAVQHRQLELAKLELENSKQELAATREELKKSSAAQELTANSLAQQAEYAATSARLSALNASLSVLSELILQHKATGSMNNQGYVRYQELISKKEKIAGEIISLTENYPKK